MEFYFVETNLTCVQYLDGYDVAWENEFDDSDIVMENDNLSLVLPKLEWWSNVQSMQTQSQCNLNSIPFSYFKYNEYYARSCGQMQDQMNVVKYKYNFISKLNYETWTYSMAKTMHMMYAQ